MKIRLKVLRFQPGKYRRPRFRSYEVEADPNERVLDLLERVRDQQDPSLAYRRSCAHGICGSDAMRINGTNALACKTLVKDIKSSTITLEPLLGLRVIKDLVVDLDPFFAGFQSITPYLVNPNPVPDGKERRQDPKEHLRYDDTTRCIQCAACTTACPVFWADPRYLGPAVLVAAHRFLFDSRDQAGLERMDALRGANGAWRCRTVFNCTACCPRGIQITRAIAEIKQKL